MTRLLTPIIVCISILSILASDDGRAQSEAADSPVAFEPTFEGVSFVRRPLLLIPGPETDEQRLYAVEQIGRITSFPNEPDITEDDQRIVLDIREKVRNPIRGIGLDGGNEEGLLGFAFHPQARNNQRVFLHYSTNDPRRGVISEWTLRSDGTIDPDSEQVLLEVEQPWSNHNGGHIEFGPDGYLYITLGDGGSGGDPQNNGQNKSTLLGSILRIDVDDTENGKPYAIPDDNPFVDDPDARPEIYAYGLRNVWRFSFDPETGDLWAGDVGQNDWEEIDIIAKGGNYGWNAREGFHPFRGGEKTDEMIDPVHEYGREAGISVTGGYVYRGSDIPEMQGAYVFGDFGTGTVWMLRYDHDREQVTEHRRIGQVPQLASFGVDHDGELYACSFQGGGRIYRMVPAE